MDLGLQGRVAAVAAASTGLGQAVARQLAREGAGIAICSRDSQRIQATAAEIEKNTGAEVWPIVADVSTLAGCRQFIAETTAHFDQLDILVTNAGGPPSGPALSFSDEQWQAAIELNLLSTIRMITTAIPHLQQSDQGRVIAITSISAKQPLENLILSNTTRAGVLGFIKSLANELGHTGITFNAVLPGWTQTARVDELLNSLAQVRQSTAEAVAASITASIPVGRMGTVAEFAAVVAFIASRQGGYLNGVALQIDGGRSQGLL
ncbi:MAG: SDR family oxidoreductase [Chloroflexi bacterium]|nr:SDR family oxidoreductase [Chloroflexota bacterium]